jgi:hypothetical protein
VAKSVAPATISSLLIALLIGMPGCSTSPKTVTKDEVASQIKQKQWDQEGNKPESVSCPDDLKPTVGAKVVCVMTVNGQTYAVDVTVTGIDGDSVVLDMHGRR